MMKNAIKHVFIMSKAIGVIENQRCKNIAINFKKLNGVNIRELRFDKQKLSRKVVLTSDYS